MTQEQFFTSIKTTFDSCVELIQKKNADYGATTSPFKNFLFSEFVGVRPERAILVRLTDKISRISNLLDAEAQVANESINDTIEDAINYLAILKAKLEENNNVPVN
jgi:hypothetical protein